MESEMKKIILTEQNTYKGVGQTTYNSTEWQTQLKVCVYTYTHIHTRGGLGVSRRSTEFTWVEGGQERLLRIEIFLGAYKDK